MRAPASHEADLEGAQQVRELDKGETMRLLPPPQTLNPAP